MRVFVTGASGFVGSAVVEELIAHGHQVLGLARAADKIEKITALGAEAVLGDVNDEKLLRESASSCDAVIHTAFNHDFSKFKDSCEADRRVITILGSALEGTAKPLVITSGIGLLNNGDLVSENDQVSADSTLIPRIATEEAVSALTAKGINAYIVRLPPSVHGKGEHGFIPILINMAKEQGESAYIQNGDNHWPAIHRLDAAKVYRLAIEKQPKLKVFHAVGEQGIAFKEIVELIGKKLDIPTVSKSSDEVQTYFTWFTHFAQMNCPSLSEKTREALNWEPSEIGLLEDMELNYF